MNNDREMSIENKSFGIRRIFLMKTDRAAFMAAYIAYDILEHATGYGGVLHSKEEDRFEETRVYCECGFEMLEDKSEFVCGRSDNHISKAVLNEKLNSELACFLKSIQTEINAIRRCGRKCYADYIRDYQHSFDLKQREKLEIIMQNECESDRNLKIDALLEEAAKFQYAITKMATKWWCREFDERLKKMISKDISDDLVKMQVRCIVVGQAQENKQILNIGYTLPFD